MIPDPVVDEVRERADIVDVLGEFVRLKRAGKEFKALCPFHDEKTPSFYVAPDKGFYKCFGCGASGDVFSFLMEHRGMEFVEAVKHVGRRSGVEIREVRSGRDEDPHRHLFEANAFARRFYRERLDDGNDGEGARRYLEGRGIDDETAERYGLGYAPPEWRALREAAAKHGIDDEVLLEVGLLKESQRASEPYDRFRDRIVFPIEWLGDRVLGFGGRILERRDPDGPPKYLNSPESPVYHKGRVLYGLPRARRAIRREEAVLVVEGYMDVVSLGAAGVEHVVAPLGTAVTQEQAKLLARYCTRVYLLFDSDAAGLRATFRAADVLLAAGLHPAVVTLPPGEDPDTVVREEGPEAIRAHLDRAVDVLDRKLQILDERDYFSSIERTRGAVDRLLPTLRAAADPALRDIYVSKVAERTGVRRQTLEEELARRERSARARPPRRAARTSRDGAERSRRSPSMPRMGPERDILRVLLRDPEGTYLEEAAERLSPEDFDDPAYRDVYEALLRGVDLVSPNEDADPGLARTLERIRSLPWDLEHPRRTLVECMNAIRRRTLERAIDEKRDALRRAARAGEEREVERLSRALEELTEEARRFGRGWKPTVNKALRVAGTTKTDERQR